MPDFVFKALYLGGLIAAEALRFPQRRKHLQDRVRGRVTESRVAGAEMLVLPLVLLGMWILPALYIFTPWLQFADYHLSSWIGWLGVIPFALGLCIRWRAHADLGRNWSSSLIVWEGQSLVTQGIYEHIRHPVYAALWLWAIAQPLLLHNWIAGLGGLVATLPLYLLRVPREERMMLEHFGDEYRQYISRTGRIFPRPPASRPPHRGPE